MKNLQTQTTMSGRVSRAFIVDALQNSPEESLADMFLVYQPQININSHRKLIGAEALIRWKNQGNLIHPGEFITIAEQEGVIQRIGLWAIREACKECLIWNRERTDEQKLRIGVNVSVQQLRADFSEHVKAILDDLEFPAHLLDLEITESYLKTKESVVALHKLKEYGVKLSLDDFGTGYSCLSNIKNLPFNTIKIDREFVKDLGQHHSKQDHAIIDLVVNLAHSMGMDTLAEGIENHAQLNLLLESGCHQYQGFLISEPLSSEEMRRFIKEVHLSEKFPQKGSALLF